MSTFGICPEFICCLHDRISVIYLSDEISEIVALVQAHIMISSVDGLPVGKRFYLNKMFLFFFFIIIIIFIFGKCL